MASIRRSLIGYSLLLMGVTFLGVGLIVDRFVSRANAAREDADEARLTQDYEVRCRESQDKFDDELLIHAQSLARELRREYSSATNRAARRSQALTGTLPTALGLDRWSAAVAGVVTNYKPTLDTVFWRTASMMQPEDVIRRSVDDSEHSELFQTQDLYQIHLPRSPGGRPAPIRPSRQSFEFPLDPDQLDRDPAIAQDHHEYSDHTVPGVGEFRRVVYRYPLARGLMGGPPPQRQPRGRGGPGGEGDRGPPRGTPPTSVAMPPSTPASTNLPGLYIQYARPKADLNAILAAHREKLDGDLAALRRETQDYRRQFLLLLVLVGVVGFVALWAGSLWIVRRGLRPLHTLSVAVSRVSERDFRLPVDPRDLSEDLLPIHDRLTQTLGALRRAFEREKQAVGDISHELRTPLAALRTTMDVALRKPRDAAQYRTTLEECREISRQLSRLVDRILTLASLDAGQGQPSRGPVDVTGLATECIAVIRPLAESHNLTFKAEVAPGVTAATDADKVREVMMNLLHNAVEYNRPGGALTLRVTREGHAVRISVTDTGIGMTPDVRAKIFERFYRADASRHTTGVHAGLGLAIVKEYIARLNGTIEVQSEPGRGTKFEVTI